MKICRFMRWKGLYGQAHLDDATLLADAMRAGVPFSCLHTCQPWGPDEDIATPERCTPERGCFEARPGLSVS